MTIILQNPANEKMKHSAVKVTEEYANLGLRTLWWGYRILEPQFFASWSKQMDAAQSAVQRRDELLQEAAELIECNLLLLGVTAVEDLLQVGVPETIAKLRGPAAIKMWVLTGDKQGTAIQIAQQCNLITAGSSLIKVPP